MTPIRTFSLIQAIVGVAGGATRAALTVHQARRDNLADISAKDGSQVAAVFITTVHQVDSAQTLDVSPFTFSQIISKI